jgi:hypothetical protein
LNQFKSPFRQDAAVTRVKERPGFPTSTLQACAPRILRLCVNFGTLLQEFFPLFLHSRFDRFFTREAMFSGVLANILCDFHAAEVRATHAAEVRGLRPFGRESFVMELASGFGIE